MPIRLTDDIIKRIERRGINSHKCVICGTAFINCPHTTAQLDQIMIAYDINRAIGWRFQ